ncbi:MAG TPA: YihY/virulence factor BrkB family protein [Gaiellaceae bacterium]|nr:YihY/virulence factor BrkB family protein [Gaiellaceae bacterium]
MKLLQRTRKRDDGPEQAQPLPEEAPEPQPEHDEPRLRDPGPTELSKRDYLAILRRAVGQANRDHITNLAAALAYYAFLAIPSALLLAAGLFGLLAGPHAVTTVIDKLGQVMPGEATKLVRGSLSRLTQKQGTSLTLIVVGGALAAWSLSGAMQNLMWALNLAYDRDETRGFVKRRLTAFTMILFALLAFALVFGLLVLGPPLSTWVGKAVGAKTVVQIAWWIAQWPLLVGGLLLAFSAILYLGPNVRHPRWRFLSFGAVVAVVAWLLASGAFAFYVSRFGSYNKTWGSLSAVVVMLTWLWLSSVALLLGAEINAEAERSRELRRGEAAEVELQAPAKA